MDDQRKGVLVPDTVFHGTPGSPHLKVLGIAIHPSVIVVYKNIINFGRVGGGCILRGVEEGWCYVTFLYTSS